jgi:hypothetical protein
MCTLNSTMKSGQTSSGLQFGRPDAVIVASPAWTAFSVHLLSGANVSVSVTLTARLLDIGVVQIRFEFRLSVAHVPATSLMVLPWSALVIVREQPGAGLGVAATAGWAMHSPASSAPMSARVFANFMDTSIHRLQHQTPPKE